IAARNIAGFTEAYSRDQVDEEETTRRYKDLAMDVGGMVIGGFAGRQGLSMAGKMASNGSSKAAAMIAERGVDATLSVVGDLAMIGMLDYDQSLVETIKQNGMGIVVSTVTGINESKRMFSAQRTNFSTTGAKTRSNTDFAPSTRTGNEPSADVKVRANETVNEVRVQDYDGQRMTENLFEQAQVKASDETTTSNKQGIDGEVIKSQSTSNVEQKIPKGYIIDSKTGKPIKVNIEKITVEKNQLGIGLKDEFGNDLGYVCIDAIKANSQGHKALHFEGMVSNVEGVGIGRMLIDELVKASHEIGCGGRLIASASPLRGTQSNLGFYYKLGFEAVNPQKHAQIQDCIQNGKEIPLALNVFTDIEYNPKLDDSGVKVNNKEADDITQSKAIPEYNKSLEIQENASLLAQDVDIEIKTNEANPFATTKTEDVLTTKPIIDVQNSSNSSILKDSRSITKNDVIKTLKEFQFSDDEIASLNLDDEVYKKALVSYLSFMKISGEMDFKKIESNTVEARKEILNQINNGIPHIQRSNIFNYVNDDNIALVREHFKEFLESDSENINDIFELFEFNDKLPFDKILDRWSEIKKTDGEVKVKFKQLKDYIDNELEAKFRNENAEVFDQISSMVSKDYDGNVNKRFKDSMQINSAIKLKVSNPELFDKIANMTEIKNNGNETPRFETVRDIEIAMNLYTSNPELFEKISNIMIEDYNGKMVYRFSREYDIEIAMRLYSDNSELFNKISDMTTNNFDNNERPRFEGSNQIEKAMELYTNNQEAFEKFLNITDANGHHKYSSVYQIEKAMESYINNPRFFDEIASMKKQNWNGDYVERFPTVDCINEAMELKIEHQKIFDEIVNMTVPNKNNQEYRFSSIDDIKKAIELKINNPELFEKFLNFEIEYSNKKKSYRFESAKEIEKAIELYITVPAKFEKFLNMKRIDNSGDENYRFESVHSVEQAINLQTSNPALFDEISNMSATTFNWNTGERIVTYRFKAIGEISSAMDMKTKNPIVFDKLVNMKIKATDGTEVYKFTSAGDIKRVMNVAERIYTDENLKNNKIISEHLDEILEMQRNEDYTKHTLDYLDNIDSLSEMTETLLSQNIKLEKIIKNMGRLYDNVKLENIDKYKFGNEYWSEYLAKVDNLEKKMLENPRLYVNGNEDSSLKLCQDEVNHWVEKNKLKLLKLSTSLDKEAMLHLMRKRFDDVDEYFDDIKKYNFEDLEMLKNLCNSTNVDGKPFMPTQKIEFIDLINSYNTYKLDMTKINTMIANGKVDLSELQVDLFNKIIKDLGFSDAEIATIPKEKLLAWDTKYVHFLTKEIREDRDAFVNVVRAANLDDFRRYIHDTKNQYGEVNARTKSQYEDLGMDYDAWVNPSKSGEVKFMSRDKNEEKLIQISNLLLEDINMLRSTPVKGVIDKRFPKNIVDGEFTIPKEIISNKTKLNEFINNLVQQLDDVWTRAKGNAEHADPKRSAMARNTLTALDHFKQRIDDVDRVSDAKIAKKIDLTIKMWDRIPQKDLFQGNYSTCCIGMGRGNGSAMPNYLLNTSFNMIEMVDNATGKIIGNALCYFIKDSNGKPAFIIDNIEINNASKPADDVGENLRDAITEYAGNIAKQVTNTDDTFVYIGGLYNDVDTYNLPKHNETISFLGEYECDNIYLDLYEGHWIDNDDLTKNLTLRRLK
ncbi:MAG: GNAT family N-acetyltransferase, partial [Candidatus Gastranaerophilales bacterium]